jgi:hypothetical protein
MLEFPIQVFEEPLEQKPYTSSFPNPVLFFMSDRRDPRSVLTSFALCDFRRGRITYIVSATPENLARMNALPAPLRRRCFPPIPRLGFRQCHSAIVTAPDESFLSFVYASEDCPFFYHVDYRRKVMQLILTDDFQALTGCGPLNAFGSTFAADPQDPQAFFLCARLAAADGRISPAMGYFRVSLNLSRANLVGTRPCAADHPCPHSTQRLGDSLISSEFYQTGLELLGSRRRFADEAELRRHVLADYWSHLDGRARAGLVARHILAHPFKSFRAVKRAWLKPTGKTRPPLSEVIVDRCFRERHHTHQFFWAARETPDYRFHGSPGFLRVLSLTDGTETAHQVTHNNPAHIEIGASGDIFLSCHNFLKWDQFRYFAESAAILRLRLTGGRVEERGVFLHPLGFRFASHVMIQNRGREFIVTIGHPNRLMVVDAESMTLASWRDIGPDHISSKADLQFYLNRSDLETVAVRSLAAGEDGRYLAISRNDAVLILDSSSLETVDTIPVSAEICRLAGCASGKVINDGVHCQRLR